MAFHLCSGFPREATLGWSWHVGSLLGGTWHPYRRRAREAAMVRCSKGTVTQSQQTSHWSPREFWCCLERLWQGASLYSICPAPTYTFRLVTGCRMAQEGHDLRPGSSFRSQVNSQRGISWMQSVVIASKKPGNWVLQSWRGESVWTAHHRSHHPSDHLLLGGSPFGSWESWELPTLSQDSTILSWECSLLFSFPSSTQSSV